MKKIIVLFVCVMLLVLVGCDFDIINVETLKGWSFQYNESTNDYSLFFGLLDENDEPVAAEVDVDIRIVDDLGEEVYAGTKSVTTDDFDYYTSIIDGEQYLANVRIPAVEISQGGSSSGTVYFTVYKENVVQFDEVSCEVLSDLPIKDVKVKFETFPKDIKVRSIMGNIDSIIQIQKAEYSFEGEYSTKLTIIVSGQKISGSDSSGYDQISYKLYDSEGYIVDSGNMFLQSLSNGDKFRDEIIVRNVIPGETYNLELFEYSW